MGKAGLVEGEFKKQCCYEWEMLCIKEMKERERERADKKQKGFDTNKSLGQQTVDTVR
jgi:hypothetical protein